MKSNRKTSATGIIKLGNITLKKPATYAAGLSGIKVALEHASKEMGLINSLKTLSTMNQPKGFDCPGCAWPDPDPTSKLGEYCENGAKALAEEASNEWIGSDFFQNNSVEALSLWSDFEIGKAGRLAEPMYLQEGSNFYEKISWGNAFNMIAAKLKNLKNPDEAIFYTSGRSSNEAAFLYGLFVRAFGTNNMPDCSNMCHESSGVALKETLGIGKGSVKLEDFPHAEVILVIGQNPGTNHPRMLSALEKCKQNGGRIVSINPLAEAGLVRFKNPQTAKGLIAGGTALCDFHLQVKINEDIALLNAFMIYLKELELKHGDIFDKEFIAQYTTGFESYKNDLDQYDLNELITQSGVDRSTFEHVAQLLADKKKIIICWAMGLTQHKNGVDNIKACVNLLLAKGSLGKKGAGTCPVRGHSNVQGDRSVGIMHHVSPQLNTSLKRVFGFEAPEHEGLDTVNSIQAMYNKKARFFMALGGNFVSAASDTAYTAKALGNCDLTVQVSTKLNRSHLITGKEALILPTIGRSELDIQNNKAQFLTVENSMGKVHQTQGKRRPRSSDLKSEPAIVSGIARHYFGGNKPIDWDRCTKDYDYIRMKLGEVLSEFEGLTSKSENSGFYLPNNVRNLDFSMLPTGKATFSPCPVSRNELKENELLLTTIRSHDQFNTTIYGLNDRYRGIFNERRVVFMNSNDMKQMNLNSLDIVDLQSNYDGIKRLAKSFKVVPYNIPSGNLAAYFPETNTLIPIDQYADKSNTPISKSVIVSIRRT